MLPFFFTQRINLFFYPDFFLDSGGFSLSSSQVKQPGPSDLTFPEDLNFFQTRGNDREDPFHADPVGNLPNSKRFAIGIDILPLDYCSLKLLDTFLVSFCNFHMDIDRVTRFESWEF